MKILFSIVCCLCTLFSLSAQQRTEITHLNGTSISTSALQKRLQHLTDSARIAGLQVTIINGNKAVWSSSFGYKDVENRKLLNDSTVMYAASLTKPVAGYLFLRLADRGIFSLDTPVYTYLKKEIGEYPKWADLADDTASFHRITPGMLLSHSSGLPVLRYLYGDKVTLIASPGEKFYYSNEGMNLLGFMIEEYTGKSLEAWAREEVFVPLQMHQTSMVWEKEFENNFSFAYYKDGSKYGSERRQSSRAAGSMSTTANDYARFFIQLLTGKGLSNPSLKEMLSPRTEVNSQRGFGPLKDSVTTENKAIHLAWGLGVGLFRSPHGAAFFHTGHGEANQNYAVAYPEKGIGVILLSNSENFESISRQIIRACIGDEHSPLKWLGHGQE